MTRLTDDDHHCRGFSLIEMAIVTVIIGFILAAMLNSFTLYRKNNVIRSTNDNLAKIGASIMNFASDNVRYPRPAPRNLQIGTANYGLETAIADLPALDSCNAEDVCRVTGARDVGLDGNPDPVLIGAIPFKSMTPDIADISAGAADKLSFEQQLSIKDTYDGWGNQFAYAVTESLTNQASYVPENGAIAIATEVGTSLVEPVGSAHLIIWSGGKNGSGVYTSDAVRRACPAGTVEEENCDGNGVPDAVFTSGLIARAAGPTYYDDLMRFQIWGTTSLWRNGGTSMWNMNPGNVGIGTDTPQERLHVAGGVEARNVLARQICDETGADCFDPALLGGSGMQCANPNEVVVRIRNGAVECSATAVPPVGNQTCPGSEVVSGLDASGTIICGNP